MAVKVVKGILAILAATGIDRTDALFFIALFLIGGGLYMERPAAALYVPGFLLAGMVVLGQLRARRKGPE